MHPAHSLLQAFTPGTDPELPFSLSPYKSHWYFQIQVKCHCLFKSCLTSSVFSDLSSKTPFYCKYNTNLKDLRSPEKFHEVKSHLMQSGLLWLSSSFVFWNFRYVLSPSFSLIPSIAYRALPPDGCNRKQLLQFGIFSCSLFYMLQHFYMFNTFIS